MILMLEKFKISKNWKIIAIYLILLLSNIVLFIGLFSYSKIGFNIDLKNFDDISAIIATIIILGYVSGKLPATELREDSPLFGFGYVLIMCAISFMTPYFISSIDTSMFDSYFDMFKILCAVLIFVILATNLKAFKEILLGKFTRKNLLICLIVFVMVGLFASYCSIDVNGAPANIRCLIVMISGLFGGPVVGIPVGIISGAYRFALGGATAVPCAVSTVLSGVIGSLIFIWNDKKFPSMLESALLMFLFIGLEMLLVVVLTPQDISFPFVKNIYPLMLFGSVIGMFLFSLVIKEARYKLEPETSYEEQKIKEFENEFEKYDEKIEMLENEIEKLKKEKNGYDSQDKE